MRLDLRRAVPRGDLLQQRLPQGVRAVRPGLRVGRAPLLRRDQIVTYQRGKCGKMYTRSGAGAARTARLLTPGVTLMRPKSTTLPATVERTCLQCERPFAASRWNIARGWGKFCSRACKNASERRSPADLLDRYTDASDGLSACWPWMGTRSIEGYGVLTSHQRQIKAHVAAWERSNRRPTPEGLVVRHLCVGGGNPWCVNPSHLEVGTNQDNVDDKVRAGRHPRGDDSSSTKITSEMLADAIECHVHGESFSSIARRLGVTSRAISVRVHTALAECCPATRQATYRTMTDEQVEEAVARSRNGESFASIARSFGVTGRAVSYRVVRRCIA